ncbi:hypothetical protein EC988_000904 [Linderina pennispora]|nr:hypothetical protein EC988_000904 [Linderina pennispora]
MGHTEQFAADQEEPLAGLLDLGGLALEQDSPSDSTASKSRQGDGLTRRERNEQYKLTKKRTEAYATLQRMEKISDLSTVFDQRPRKTMCIVNIGFGAVGGATVAELEAVFSEFEGFERVVMKLGKPYSFVIFRSGENAQSAHEVLHERMCEPLGKILFLEYLTHRNFAYLADRVSPDDTEGELLDASRGLHYFGDFITEQEEKDIMEHIRIDEEAEIARNNGSDKWTQVQERYVKHYGHSFDYHIKHVGSDSLTASTELPPWMQPFIDRIRTKLPGYPGTPNQLTIQRYPPGSGIAFHTDSHTAFTDMIVILSMGSPVQMDFRKPASHDSLVTIDLEPRSLVVMTGEARYGWEHAIRIRRSDLVDGRVRERCERWSITIRTINEQMTCSCAFSALCDTNSQMVQRLRRERV